MKNVLIITFSFPPMSEVAAVRPQGLANYLPLYGWNPGFLTPHLPGEPGSHYTVIQTEYDDIKHYWLKKFHIHTGKRKTGVDRDAKDRLLKIYNTSVLPPILRKIVFFPAEFFVYPDLHIGWYNFALSEGRKYIENNQVDAIISTSPPNTCHLIAKELSDAYNIPWIADFRDLWTLNPNRNYTSIREHFEKKMEIRTIQSAKAISTVSIPLMNKMQELHKDNAFFSIPNGFDLKLLNPGNALSNTFRIVYTGELYYGRQDPSLLFRAIQNLIIENEIEKEDINIDFYGGNNARLQKEISTYHLQDLVTLHRRVPREKAIDEQRKSQILLLLNWNDPTEEGIYTGKLFDYLAAKRPILSIGLTDGGVVKELLDHTGAGVYISNEDDLKKYLIQSYKEFKEMGSVSYSGIVDEIMKYSHIEMAKKFAYILDIITDTRDNVCKMEESKNMQELCL